MEFILRLIFSTENFTLSPQNFCFVVSSDCDKITVKKLLTQNKRLLLSTFRAPFFYCVLHKSAFFFCISQVLDSTEHFFTANIKNRVCRTMPKQYRCLLLLTQAIYAQYIDSRYANRLSFFKNTQWLIYLSFAQSIFPEQAQNIYKTSVIVLIVLPNKLTKILKNI